ncbi:E3 ubiquitin-protein ligase BOI-like isoform X2 [Malania oleifera]|uniref:E3 ubiquitin-protein ligase BOI-like isoform X2 n=1 Tax=Malania oleifera TaxID=397392 RepID=UPI0025AEA09C|nr:E3 ubiquitin-protein ligase BOI-like isoform X2 [Malania oleifera]
MHTVLSLDSLRRACSKIRKKRSGFGWIAERPLQNFYCTTFQHNQNMNMFGGDGSNPVFPVFLEENRLQYDANALPQLQLFGDFPVGCSVNPLNYMGNEHTGAMNRPIKRGREAESVSRQPKFHISLNNNLCQDEAGHSGSIMNPNAVSTGLRLSYEEDEHNSSVTTASESMTAALPVILSLGDNLKTEIDRQKEELDNYIQIQEENIMKGVRELKQRHTLSFLSAIEKGVSRKIREKELELENMNRKNKELTERTNLKQVIAQGAAQVKEGCGDSEVDDAVSYSNANNQANLGASGNSLCMKAQMYCRACKGKEVSVLLLPCRHLCLCKDCEGFIDICPVCRVVKTASVQVYMS